MNNGKSENDHDEHDMAQRSLVGEYAKLPEIRCLRDGSGIERVGGMVSPEMLNPESQPSSLVNQQTSAHD